MCNGPHSRLQGPKAVSYLLCWKRWAPWLQRILATPQWPWIAKNCWRISKNWFDTRRGIAEGSWSPWYWCASSILCLITEILMQILEFVHECSAFRPISDTSIRSHAQRWPWDQWYPSSSMCPYVSQGKRAWCIGWTWWKVHNCFSDFRNGSTIYLKY